MGPFLDSETNANVGIRIQQERKVSVETNVFDNRMKGQSSEQISCFQVGAMGVKRGMQRSAVPPRHTHFHTMHPKTLRKVLRICKYKKLFVVVIKLIIT